ncbi:MAG: hypothetical protein H0W01_00300, partial [Pseudonocardiales bacterium]|nr:hypothetical protein [Pseudonocardiales bacterium]
MAHAGAPAVLRAGRDTGDDPADAEPAGRRGRPAPSVGARAPSWSISGPAQLVQVGNTELDISRLEVHGPLRPQLTMGPVLRNDAAAAVLDPATSARAQQDAVTTVGDGFLRWYVWGAIGLAVF